MFLVSILFLFLVDVLACKCSKKVFQSTAGKPCQKIIQTTVLKYNFFQLITGSLWGDNYSLPQGRLYFSLPADTWNFSQKLRQTYCRKYCMLSYLNKFDYSFSHLSIQCPLKNVLDNFKMFWIYFEDGVIQFLIFFLVQSILGCIWFLITIYAGVCTVFHT